MISSTIRGLNENFLDLKKTLLCGLIGKNSMLSWLPSEIIEMIASFLRPSDIEIFSVFLDIDRMRENVSKFTVEQKYCPGSFGHGMVEINLDEKSIFDSSDLDWNYQNHKQLACIEVKRLIRSYDLFRIKASNEHGISHWSIVWSFPFTIERVLVTKTSMSLLIEQEEFYRSINILRNMRE